ncbi:MAG: hypothetical protein M1828_006185 [Chrysothrix sp. TS-e1954]|nr:MAG: hypothetical protein M1828_006185 [Chrysothrix sp. TS-e1954]
MLKAPKACTQPAVDVDPQLAEKIFSTNVVGAVRLVHFLHRHIVSAKGTIALMGSVCGIAPAPWLSVYNASKAALHQFGNTLRIELEPLGAHVVIIVGGLVQTKFLLDDKNKLASDSLYLPLEKEVLDTWSDTSQATPPDVFAANVVNAILKRSPPTWYWTGAFSNILWTIATFLPHRVFDLFYNSLIPLKKLKSP